MTIFTLEDVRKTFVTGEVEEEILKGINLTLKEGEVTALVGASGSGKSTLLTIAAGLQPVSDGQVIFDGNNMTAMSSEQVRKIRASKFGFVFQFAHLVPFLTVEEQLMLMPDVSESNLSKQEKHAEVNNILQLVEMNHRKHAYPSSLSGEKNNGSPLPEQSSINRKFSLQMNQLPVLIQGSPEMLCC